MIISGAHSEKPPGPAATSPKYKREGAGRGMDEVDAPAIVAWKAATDAARDSSEKRMRPPSPSWAAASAPERRSPRAASIAAILSAARLMKNSCQRRATRGPSEGHQRAIRGPSEGHQGHPRAIRGHQRPSEGHQRVIRGSSEGHPWVIRGTSEAIRRPSEGHQRPTGGSPSGTHLLKCLEGVGACARVVERFARVVWDVVQGGLAL